MTLKTIANFCHVLSFILVNYSVTVHGVCALEILSTYTQTGELIFSLNVGEACDQDYGNPEYSYSSYSIYSDFLVEVYYTVDKPKDYDEFYSDTSDFHKDVEMITETTYSHYTIESNGTFKPVKKDNSNGLSIVSERILNKEDLENKSPSELRILRNEIFARKGYIFKSEDLLKYFNEFEWYKPNIKKIEDIKLSVVEKYNIKKIKEAENQ